MTTLFRLDASIRIEGSNTRALGDMVEHAAVGVAADTTVIRRDVGLDPLPSTAWSTSSQAAMTPEDRWTPDQLSARRLASTLGDELERSDAFIFAAPLYNWGVSQHFKTWADIVITDPRFAPRTSTIAGRSAVLVVARGGDYREDSPQAGWDHATSWMRRILGDVWGLDLRVVQANMTLAPVRPHMAHLREDAAADLARASAGAHAAGVALAGSLLDVA